MVTLAERSEFRHRRQSGGPGRAHSRHPTPRAAQPRLYRPRRAPSRPGAAAVGSGGGGVSANERANELRLKAFGAKKSQLDAIQVDAMVSACSNCRIVLEEGLEEYHMDVPILSLTELIEKHLAD